MFLSFRSKLAKRGSTPVETRDQGVDQILEQAIDAVVSIDASNRVTFFNPAAERLWGYRADEVIGQNVRMLVPEEFRSGHDSFVDANRRTGIDKIVGTSRDVDVVRRDGSRVCANLSLSRVKVGDEIHYTAFVKDVSAERRAQEIVTQTLEQAIDAVVTIDADNEVTFFNPAAERLWGYRADEVIGQNVRMLVPDEIRAQHDSLVDANRRTGVDKIVGTTRDVEIQRRDGSRIWGNLSLSKIQLDGETLYTAFVKDITEQRAARERIDQTLEQAIDAVVSIDADNRVTFFNAAAERLWGYQRGEVIGENVRMLVPREIQSQHDSFVNANRNTGVDRIVGTSREVDVHRKDGTVVNGRLSLSKVEVGGEVTYTAFVADVTEELKNRARMNILSLVADETGNSVVITDPQGRIEYVNPGFTRMTGYAPDEVMGRKPGEVLQGEHTDPEAVVRIRERLAHQKPFYEEILNYHKDGSAYWISLSVNPIFGEGGRLERFISIQANITDTKESALEFTSRLEAIGRSNMVLEWNVKGRFLQANALSRRTLQLGDGKLPDLGELVTEEDFETIRTGGYVSRTLDLRGTGDITVSASGAIQGIVDYKGDVTRIVFYGVDVSDRRRVVTDSIQTMRSVLDRINEIANAITKISQATRLLSFNASIEAASAGDAGRGFAVVADEVRELAGSTSESASEIATLADETRVRIAELDQSLD